MIPVSVINADLGRAKEFQNFIDATNRYRCVSVYGNLVSARSNLLSVKPGIVLFDSELPEEMDCLKALKMKLADTEFVACLENIEAGIILRIIDGGATGFLCSCANRHSIIKALDVVSAGGSPLCPEIARIVLRALGGDRVGATPLPGTLTRRESEVLSELAKGRMLKEITTILDISQGTLNTHLRNLYRKLRVNSRSEIMSLYFSNGHSSPPHQRSR